MATIRRAIQLSQKEEVVARATIKVEEFKEFPEMWEVVVAVLPVTARRSDPINPRIVMRIMSVVFKGGRQRIQPIHNCLAVVEVRVGMVATSRAVRVVLVVQAICVVSPETHFTTRAGEEEVPILVPQVMGGVALAAKVQPRPLVVHLLHKIPGQVEEVHSEHQVHLVIMERTVLLLFYVMVRKRLPNSLLSPVVVQIRNMLRDSAQKECERNCFAILFEVLLRTKRVHFSNTAK